jgi:hypothetical protein
LSSSPNGSAIAVALAFLVVIPEGDLLSPFAVAVDAVALLMSCL